MIHFYKYQGTGNDFVIIDNRNMQFPKQEALVKKMCDRRFGIGADGLILLENETGYDFKMQYYNADGNESTMCGNGGRCITAFARKLGIIEEKALFLAIDGPHHARVSPDNQVELQMSDVKSVEIGDGYYVLDTGSPHYVIFVEDLDDIDVVENGQAIRYSKRFREEGVNVNFVEKTTEGILVATYERGVENETLSCGTGVTAAALAYHLSGKIAQSGTVAIQSKGGKLQVRYEAVEDGGFRQIWLCGKGELVFEGDYGG